MAVMSLMFYSRQIILMYIKDVWQTFMREARVLRKRMTENDERFKECLEMLITKAMVV